MFLEENFFLIPVESESWKWTELPIFISSLIIQAIIIL